MYFKLPLAGIIVAMLAGCGGGGGVSEELSDSVGDWQGAVSLTSNGCPREIPSDSRTLTFSHRVSESLDSPSFATITLVDENVECKDLRAIADSNRFAAVCPENILPDFLPDLDCTEQRVWEYTVVSGNPGFVDVVRTAYVHCMKNGLPQLACPVVYDGNASRTENN